MIHDPVAADVAVVAVEIKVEDITEIEDEVTQSRRIELFQWSSI